MQELLNRMRDELRPDINEEDVQDTVEELNAALDNEGLDAECMVGGSFAKDTHLKDDYDVDLFVQFDQSSDTSELADLLENALPFDAERVHGSRDYFRLERDALTYEIVPVVRVENYTEAENVTDMSPLHVKYLKERLDGLNDDVRLAKQFCKANKVYGAESYIRGFSGHVVDLLVLYYGGFEELVRAAASWGERVVIDMESHWANPLQELNEDKIESPLVLIDPLQPERNAAAALSREKFDLFKARCKAFLDEPSEEFFTIRHLDPEEIEPEEDYFVYFTATPVDNKNDVQGAKLRQVYEYIHRKVRDRQWPIEEADWEFYDGEGRFYFIITTDAEPYVERRGPPLEQEDNVKRFTEKHANTLVKDGRIYARIDRRHSHPKDYIEYLTGHKYVEERVEQVAFERWQ